MTLNIQAPVLHSATECTWRQGVERLNGARSSLGKFWVRLERRAFFFPPEIIRWAVGFKGSMFPFSHCHLSFESRLIRTCSSSGSFLVLLTVTAEKKKTTLEKKRRSVIGMRDTKKKRIKLAKRRFSVNRKLETVTDNRQRARLKVLSFSFLLSFLFIFRSPMSSGIVHETFSFFTDELRYHRARIQHRIPARGYRKMRYEKVGKRTVEGCSTFETWEIA